MSHTPGPWHLGGVFNPNGPDPRMNVWGKTPRGSQSGDVVAQSVRPSDANLIAAAPDLLDAAQSTLQYMDETRFCECDGECECIVGALRKAIAKAEVR